MSDVIRLAVIGYGNLGKGVEKVIGKQADLNLVGIFSRREPASLQSDAPAYALADLPSHADRIDVCLLCGGSATDLDKQGPAIAARFNTVDTFDTHARIPAYFAAMDKAAKAAGNVAIISAGWDPGLFSLMRVYQEAVLPDGEGVTFWGKGVSQGHGDAVRRIPGVRDAVQYTIPLEEAKRRFRSGQRISEAPRERHKRECFVVLEDGADPDTVRTAIVTMPHYFADYDTDVHFISAAELAGQHKGMPHGGSVLRRGETSPGTSHLMEFSLSLDSNPEFTASVLVASARAAFRMAQAGVTGALTLLDVPPALLSRQDNDTLRRERL